jgi:hypothetical protein
MMEMSKDFKIIAELSPGRIHGLSPYMPWVVELADAVDIPESPLGIPHPNAVAVAAYLKALHDIEVYPHLRLKDLNDVSLVSLAYAVRILGIDGLVMLRGEGKGKDCLGITTEDALKKVTSVKGLAHLKIGAVLSLRYDPRSLKERLSQPFKFFLILRYSRKLSREKSEILYQALKSGKELYPYLIISTNVNRSLVESLGQPYVRESEIRDLIEEIEGKFSGIVISVPQDREGMKRILENLRRR